MLDIHTATSRRVRLCELAIGGPSNTLTSSLEIPLLVSPVESVGSSRKDHDN